MLRKHLDYKLLEKCLECGACYQVCPSALQFEGYDPRAVIKDILAHEHARWIESKHIWQCLECHQCLEMCFQHYGFENAMTAMRTLATTKGHHPPQVKRGWDLFVKTSRLGEPALPARKKFGLPEPMPSAKEEFRKMVEVYRDMREAEKSDKLTQAGTES